MNLILFVLATLISFVAVRIGAVALHLTGVEWSQAKFQALSCFTGTGFTTNPPGDLQLHLGDNLLCFGEPDKIRDTLLPTR
jgi:Trk-type K+ transport system membrane component